MTVYHFHRFTFDLVSVCFCVFKRLQSLERQGLEHGTQRRTWHDFLLVRVPVCFRGKFYVNPFSYGGIQIAPGCAAAREQALSSAYPICHRSKPDFIDFLRTHGSNVAREGGSQRRGVSRLNGATVPPALRSFACKPIFRSVRSYFSCSSSFTPVG